jgi:hypothetical protein
MSRPQLQARGLGQDLTLEWQKRWGVIESCYLFRHRLRKFLGGKLRSIEAYPKGYFYVSLFRPT